ncbi:MAG: hypothetical protein IKF82_07130 [Bacilli bacterium]|nr:hypothetical protein [Bacilli bacterium]
MILNDDETKLIYGGGIGLFAGISAAIAFLISIADGFLNPGRCNSEN